METQFSLGSADNKGILSLLSAIEQVVLSPFQSFISIPQLVTHFHVFGLSFVLDRRHMWHWQWWRRSGLVFARSWHHVPCCAGTCCAICMSCLWDVRHSSNAPFFWDGCQDRSSCWEKSDHQQRRCRSENGMWGLCWVAQPDSVSGATTIELQNRPCFQICFS